MTLVERRGPVRRLQTEEGVALIIALMATMLLTALGSALILLTTTETAITTNFRNAQEALYAADAGIERVVQDLLTVAEWDDVLAGTLQSGFAEGSLSPTLPDGTPISLTAETTNLQSETDTFGVWGPNNPVWRLYAYGPINGLLPTGTINSLDYVAVWVADDPSDTDGNPLVDTNGVLTLHAVGYGPSNTRKVVEAAMAESSSTEIERGMIAQRGQEELNQRSRKAAVQTPGTGLTGMRMGSGGGIVVQ